MFFPGEKVKFICTSKKLVDDLFKSKLNFTVVHPYKHHILCKSESGYRESFKEDEIKKI